MHSQSLSFLCRNLLSRVAPEIGLMNLVSLKIEVRPIKLGLGSCAHVLID